MSANRQAALQSETSERDVPKPKEELEYVEIGPIPDLREGTEPGQDSEELECVEIGPLLRDLRGELSLRQLEEETGIAYSYLSVIERGNKRPGPKVLSRLAAYHDVPLDELLGAAGYPQQPNEGGKPTIADIQRSFRFLVEDPELEEFQKPSEAAPIDLKRFAIQLYEHYTGKRLLNRRPTA
jgi:transcriptional regulator with XRE-family HTH domain